MARPTRHFKIAYNWNEVGRGLKYGVELQDIVGLFNFMVRGMQFSYDYVVEDVNGQQLPNGTWTGVVGLLNRSEIDYAPAALMLSEEEWDAMAYNYPYANDELVFVTRKPEYSSETMALFRTLSSNVWCSLLACIVLVTLACFAAMKHRCTLEDVLLHVFAIGLNQGGNLVPRRAREVLLLSTWLGAMAVFTLCFKSVLLSFLTFPALSGVRTVPELAAAIRDGQYIACNAYADDNFPNYLQRSPNEDLRAIGENMLVNDIGYFEDLYDKSPKYPLMALIVRRSHVAFADGELYISKDNMGSFYFSTAVRKDFCCKVEIDLLAHRYLAAGINQKIEGFTSYMHDLILEADLGENNTRKITVTDISGALILLVAGHCLSVCVLIVECWIKRREKRHSSTRTTQSGGV